MTCFAQLKSQGLCQVVLTWCLLYLAGSLGQAQNQPIEQVWSPAYSLEVKSVMGNQNGWWITAREQLSRDARYRPVLLHWQPSAESFVIHRLWDNLTLDDDARLGGHVSSLQKLADGRIGLSANYDLACDLRIPNPLTNKALLTSDSLTTLWQLNEVVGFKESYTFPSDTALVFADSIYVVSSKGQPVISKGYSLLQSPRHVPYQKDKVGIISDEGISLYDQKGTQLHRNISFNFLDATHWQGDTIAATEGETLLLLDSSLQIMAQKDLSPHFSSAPVLTTWQDRLLLAGLNPQKTEWQVKAMTMNRQMSNLVAFGDSTWTLKDMHVKDSVLGVTGSQKKRNRKALLFKTIHLPDTIQDRSIDVALTNISVDHVSFDEIGGRFDGLYDVKYDLQGKVRNNSSKDTIHSLGMYLDLQSPNPCPSNDCFQANFHQFHDSLKLPPGESKTLLLTNVVDRCRSDTVNMEICPTVMAPDQAPDPNINNNSYCDSITLVGIETPSLSSHLKIYPTYVTENLVVETEVRIDDAKITIHNIQGELIHQSEMSGNRQTIDLNSQSMGVYVATVRTHQGKYSRKFVIGK